MPLKPIFDKAPLTTVPFQPLSAGFVRMNDSAAFQQLYTILCAADAPAALEPAFRLACLVCDKPMAEPIVEKINKHLKSQKPDGSFAVAVCDAVAILRAAWAMYEYESRLPLLDVIAKWCAWASANMDTLIANDDLWPILPICWSFWRTCTR